MDSIPRQVSALSWSASACTLTWDMGAVLMMRRGDQQADTGGANPPRTPSRPSSATGIPRSSSRSSINSTPTRGTKKASMTPKSTPGKGNPGGNFGIGSKVFVSKDGKMGIVKYVKNMPAPAQNEHTHVHVRTCTHTLRCGYLSRMIWHTTRREHIVAYFHAQTHIMLTCTTVLVCAVPRSPGTLARSMSLRAPLSGFRCKSLPGNTTASLKAGGTLDRSRCMVFFASRNGAHGEALRSRRS